MSMPSFEESARVRRRPRPVRIIFDLPMARGTLPLARRVVDDIVEQTARLAHQNLQFKRQSAAASLDWEAKKQLRCLGDEIEKQTATLRSLREELSALGSVLLDAVQGIAGFPTIVNGSLAYLVYRQEDGDIRHWRYRDQPKLRPIPGSWFSDSTATSEESEGLLV